MRKRRVKPCECGYLEAMSALPKMPIKFDEKMNEYSIQLYNEQGQLCGDLNIYYCLMCGGKAPESKRSSFFTKVTNKEANRLFTLFNHLQTVDEIIQQLGAPDEERTFSTETKPERLGYFIPVPLPYRHLIYRRFSKTADVCFSVFKSGEVNLSVTPRYLPEGAEPK